ncbi:MAG: hypothetical protein ACTSV7_13710 [Candidatus Baldrarchaeia archaeon]
MYIQFIPKIPKPKDLKRFWYGIIGMNAKIYLKNLTPHGVRIVDEQGNLLVEILPSGQVARLVEEVSRRGDLEVEGEKIPLYQKKMGRVEGLPAPKEGTLYIVSLPVAQALAGLRNDLVVPHPLVRDSEGKVIGAGGLAFVGGGQE